MQLYYAGAERCGSYDDLWFDEKHFNGSSAKKIMNAPISTHTDKLPLMEHFYTLQGEGNHTGNAAYFIRLGGCDIGCVWCDVKESWDAAKHEKYAIEDIVNLVKSTSSKIAVITGGEPAMYDLSRLVSQLKNAGIRAHIETSG